MFFLFVIQYVTYCTCVQNREVFLIYYLVILSSNLLVFYMIIYYIYFSFENNQIQHLNSILFQKKKKWR